MSPRAQPEMRSFAVFAGANKTVIAVLLHPLPSPRASSFACYYFYLCHYYGMCLHVGWGGLEQEASGFRVRRGEEREEGRKSRFVLVSVMHEIM